MATNVGKVGIVMKGDWNSASTYEVLDAVTYSGSLYIAKQDVPANTTPTNTTYWQLATDLTAKADKVSGATANNLAALDANGNLIDSNISVTASTTTYQEISISDSDTIDITASGAGSYSLMLLGRKTNSNVYADVLMLGYGGGISRNHVIIREKGAGINTIGYATSDNTDRTLKITFSGSFSDLTVGIIIIPVSPITFNISKS